MHTIENIEDLTSGDKFKNTPIILEDGEFISEHSDIIKVSCTKIDSDFNDGYGLINKSKLDNFLINCESITNMSKEALENMSLFDITTELSKSYNGLTEANNTLTKKKIKQMIKSAKRTGNYMEVKKLERMYSECKL